MADLLSALLFLQRRLQVSCQPAGAMIAVGPTPDLDDTNLSDSGLPLEHSRLSKSFNLDPLSSASGIPHRPTIE